MNQYFDKPTQVKFFEPNEGEWCYGIAYKNEIICACCGSVFEIEEVSIIKPLTWVGFGDWIKEDE